MPSVGGCVQGWPAPPLPPPPRRRSRSRCCCWVAAVLDAVLLLQQLLLLLLLPRAGLFSCNMVCPPARPPPPPRCSLSEATKRLAANRILSRVSEVYGRMLLLDGLFQVGTPRRLCAQELRVGRTTPGCACWWIAARAHAAQRNPSRVALSALHWFAGGRAPWQHPRDEGWVLSSA